MATHFPDQFISEIMNQHFGQERILEIDETLSHFRFLAEQHVLTRDETFEVMMDNVMNCYGVNSHDAAEDAVNAILAGIEI